MARRNGSAAVKRLERAGVRPTLARAIVAQSKAVCRECFCVDGAACVGGCSWVESDLCSRCAR